jgi:photosystem II stability/assembly factor-like uncharacterized protein
LLKMILTLGIHGPVPEPGLDRAPPQGGVGFFSHIARSDFVHNNNNGTETEQIMKRAILGASGRVALRLLREALARGHNVTFSLRKVVATAVLLAVGLAAQAASAVLPEADVRGALIVAQGEHSAVLDVARAGKRLVAVGERGLVLLSDDQGNSWKQAALPSSVTLTSVSFVDAHNGWAVGHFGMVFHSANGGNSWQVQLDGSRVAALVLKAAETRSEQAAADDRKALMALRNARRLVADGPDKPFLDVHFLNEREGLVVGAYGLILATGDGGSSWTALNANLDNPAERHLYSIADSDGRLFLAGEEGLLFRSLPGDLWHFERLSTDYDGSFFTLSASHNHLVVAGLRGNAFRSLDAGDSWQPLSLPSEASVVASEIDANGDLLLLNQAGQLLTGKVFSPQLQVLRSAPVVAPAAMLRLNDQALLLSGLQGLSQIAIPGGDARTAQSDLRSGH